MIRMCFAIAAKMLFNHDYQILKNRLLFENENVRIEDDLLVELTKLLISGEDHRFRYHIGFDIVAIARAVKNRLFNGKREGASTIEQQLVRVLINDYKPTLYRKVKEILLSTTAADIVPKYQLPRIYLSIAYYGTNMKGFNEAHRKILATYPQIDKSILCTELVARIKYPEPRQLSFERKLQIDRRKIHLIKLYKRHSRHKIFNIHG